MEDLPVGWVKIQSRGVCGFRSVQDLKGENSVFVLALVILMIFSICCIMLYLRFE